MAIRAAALERMAAEPVDVLIIGGGITGAGIARDAARRGLRTALVDKGDFGSGTSSVSSRLVHGGLRYLEQRDFGLVLEASRERRVLLRIAPHLVRPLPFLFPVYRGSRVPAWKLRAGMWLYDLLAGFRTVRTHRWLGPRKVRELEPGLRDKDLVGAALYYDAQTDDARLVLATVRSAVRAGALAANYVEVTGLLKPGGLVRGASVRDLLGGKTHTIRALTVVNATGPWADRIRRLDAVQAPPPPLLRLTRGAHVAIPRARLGHIRAVTLTSPLDGRVMFVLPWGDLSYVGTTDTDTDTGPDDVRATGDDVVYLLRSANAFFPQARLGPKDIVSTWAGLRPLLAGGTVPASDASREHRVVESGTGLVTIVGGKLTTYRIMARDVVDVVARKLHELDGRPVADPAPTHAEPLPGGEAAELGVLVESAARAVGEPAARHLVASYGSEAAAVVNHAQKTPGLGRPIVSGRPEIWAEVRHAVEREMAVRLGDVLIRRLHLFHETADHGVRVAPAVARLMGQLLGWDDTREAGEVAAYGAMVERAEAFRKELSS